MSDNSAIVKVGRDDSKSSKFEKIIPDPEKDPDFLYGTFPKGFLLGAATAAGQIEGGFNEDGRGDSVWDHVVKTQISKIEDGLSCQNDSYRLYKADVQALKELEANVYRFSISWTRMLPNGEIKDGVNQGGVAYYNRLIDELLAAGITPIVTLYHWDMPQVLADKYSWLDEEIIDYFVNFSRACFENFGDRVKYWLTINEPGLHALAGYDLGIHPPFKNLPKKFYDVVHNLLKAHALTYRLYDSTFRASQNGKVGIGADCWGLIPMDPENKDDLKATETAFQFKLGHVMHPVTFGCYPPIMVELAAKKSKEEGLAVSRLPEFDAEWSAKLKGSYDFLGFNHYTCEKVTTFERAEGKDLDRAAWTIDRSTGPEGDQNTFRFYDRSWPVGLSWWLKYTPWAIRIVLNYFKNNYNNPEVIICENGWSTEKDEKEDQDRSYYHTSYLNEIMKAVNLDECNVKGYCAWSLLDSWEWTAGYTVSFGLFHVDLNDPERKRTAKASAKCLAKIYRNRGFLKAD